MTDAWIFVFDIDPNSATSPNPLKVVHRIATDSASLMHFAFEVAVKKTVANEALGKFRSTLVERIAARWDSGLPQVPKGRKGKK